MIDALEKEKTQLQGCLDEEQNEAHKFVDQMESRVRETRQEVSFNLM